MDPDNVNTQLDSPNHDDSEKPQDLPTPHILIRMISNRNSTELTIQLESISSHHPMTVTALLDSGATGLFTDADFVQAKNLTVQKLP